MLEGLGLKPAAESVYRMMLMQPSWGVAEIARGLAMDSAEVRGALDDLADLALLRPSAEMPGHLHPVGPELGLSTLLARKQAALSYQEQEVAEGRAAMASWIAEFAPRHASADDCEVEHLNSVDEVRDRVQLLAAAATREALSFMPGGAQSAASMAASRSLDEGALSRGVRLRTVYLDSVRNDHASLRYAQWLSALGGETRTAPSLPLRMLVVDETVAVIPVDPNRPGPEAVVLHGRGIVSALAALFEQVWVNAVPLEPTPRGSADRLSRQELELLRILAQGHTDEAVAHKLGVSLRTVRRMMADIMARAQAKSRFQAGIRVVQMGWIESQAEAGAPPGQRPSGIPAREPLDPLELPARL